MHMIVHVYTLVSLDYTISSYIYNIIAYELSEVMGYSINNYYIKTTGRYVLNFIKLKRIIL